ncbi:hypothetical protein LPJ62_007015, partial [Coemansia sp. RSA 2167]
VVGRIRVRARPFVAMIRWNAVGRARCRLATIRVLRRARLCIAETRILRMESQCPSTMPMRLTDMMTLTWMHMLGSSTVKRLIRTTTTA